MTPCPCHEPLVPGHRCWATEAKRMRMLERVAEAAREHRATIHMRLHPTAVNRTGEALDDALSALPAGEGPEKTSTATCDHSYALVYLCDDCGLIDRDDELRDEEDERLDIPTPPAASEGPTPEEVRADIIATGQAEAELGRQPPAASDEEDSDRAAAWLEANDKAPPDLSSDYVLSASGSARRSLARLLSEVRAEATAVERERAAKVVDHQASVRRMRAQSFADDSDRADGEAQSDDIEREEAIAEALEYTAARIRQRPAGEGGSR